MTIKAGGSATPSPKATVPSGTPTPSPGPSAGEANGAQKFGATGATGAGKVWMPVVVPATPLPSYAPPSAQQFGGGSWMSTAQAEALYFQWNQRQRDDFRAKAMTAGLLKFGDGDIEAAALWKALTDQAANYGANGQTVSPLDLLANYVKQNTNGSQWQKQGDFEVNQLTGERRYVGPQFKTTTAQNTNLTDPATARAITTQIYQQLLGRDPGKGELAAYAAALSQSEAENPSTQTTTTEFDEQGNPINTSTLTAGGVSAEGQQLLAMDQVKKKPEYANVQAATTYANALQAAVGGS